MILYTNVTIDRKVYFSHCFDLGRTSWGIIRSCERAYHSWWVMLRFIRNWGIGRTSGPRFFCFLVRPKLYLNTTQSRFSNHGWVLRDLKLAPPSLFSGSVLDKNWSINFFAFLSFRNLGYFTSALRISSYISIGSSDFYPKGTYPHRNSNIQTPREYRSTVKL